LFDKVLLIHDGRCIFFGPRKRARQYFEDLGFKCLPRQTTADFLTSVTDPYAHVAEDGIHTVPKTAREFEHIFQESDDSKANFEAIGSLEAEKNGTFEKGSRHGYTLSFFEQVQLCTIRQFQVLWGDKISFFGKYILVTFISLVFGSLFYNQPETTSGVFTRGGVILYFPLFVS